MKKLIAILILTAGTLYPALIAQGEWQWAKTYSGSDDPDNYYNIWNDILNSAFDEEGNVYVFGHFGNGARIDGEPILDQPVRIGYWLGKFSPEGQLLWKKVICSFNQDFTSAGRSYGWMELRDNKVTISGDYGIDEMANRPFDYVYWLDTLVYMSKLRQIPTNQRYFPFTFGGATFFVTCDLDGNVVAQHFVQLKTRPSDYGLLVSLSDVQGRVPFHIDRNGNIFVYCLYDNIGPESEPLTIIVNDTLNYPFYVPTLSDTALVINVYMFKFSPDWELLQAKLLIDHTEGLNPILEDSRVAVFIRLTGLSYDEEDNMYISGAIDPFADMNYHPEAHDYPAHIYWDSTHYQTIYDNSNRIIPFLIKYDTNNTVLWSNQVYAKKTPQTTFIACIESSGNIYRDNKIIMLGKADDLDAIIFFENDIANELPRICINRAFFAAFDAQTGVFQHYGLVPDTRNSNFWPRTTIPAYINNQIFALALTGEGNNRFKIVRWGDDGTVLETIPFESDFRYNETGQIIVSEDGHLFVTGVVKQGQQPNSPLVFNDELTFYISATVKSMTFMAMYYDTAFTVPYVGIKESATAAHNYMVYPNPTTKELRIKNYELEYGDKVEIYNMLGQKQSLPVNHYPLTTINVSHLAAGMYILKITKRNNECSVMRFAKMNN
jgi:hypothetical protein